MPAPNPAMKATKSSKFAQAVRRSSPWLLAPVCAAALLVGFDRLRMLFSPSAKLALAHYPKTAGHSLVGWFRKAFPDAAFCEPPTVHTISHLPVRESLARLERASRRRRLLAWLPGRVDRPARYQRPRIIGVIREPFEMLVSLFEYWRSYDFAEPPQPPLISAARERPFRDFLALAVVDHPVQNYYDFFDVGGPAWADTRLLAFDSLEPALAAACREFGVQPPEATLERRNIGPRQGRDLAPYRTEAGGLIDEVRRHFRWYYEEGYRLAVRGVESS